MGLYTRKHPSSIRLGIPETYRELVDEFNTWCIVNDEKFTDVIMDLIQAKLKEVNERTDFFAGDWLDWNEFRAAMKEKGFSLNRTTMFNYRKKSPETYVELVRSDGVSTRYHFEKILEHFQNG